MTVSSHPRDSAGIQLQAGITALTAKLLITTGTLQKVAMQAQLDQFQRELVNHYFNIGRLNAALVLSTMT